MTPPEIAMPPVRSLSPVRYERSGGHVRFPQPFTENANRCSGPLGVSANRVPEPAKTVLPETSGDSPLSAGPSRSAVHSGRQTGAPQPPAAYEWSRPLRSSGVLKAVLTKT